MPLADAIRDRRKELGMTQQDLADVLGWPQSSIGRLENGDRKHLRSDSLIRLATALKIRPDKLLV